MLELVCRKLASSCVKPGGHVSTVSPRFFTASAVSQLTAASQQCAPTAECSLSFGVPSIRGLPDVRVTEPWMPLVMEPTETGTPALYDSHEPQEQRAVLCGVVHSVTLKPNETAAVLQVVASSRSERWNLSGRLRSQKRFERPPRECQAALPGHMMTEISQAYC